MGHKHGVCFPRQKHFQIKHFLELSDVSFFKNISFSCIHRIIADIYNIDSVFREYRKRPQDFGSPQSEVCLYLFFFLIFIFSQISWLKERREDAS